MLGRLQLQARTFNFAKAVVGVHMRNGVQPRRAPDLVALIDACTSVVSNLEEADEASSDADFIAKMNRVRETRESG